ncbi:unnamed protein product [Bathycoccus prasinos]
MTMIHSSSSRKALEQCDDFSTAGGGGGSSGKESKNTTKKIKKKLKKTKQHHDHMRGKRIYRFSTLVPNTIPHMVMKSRKDWREIPLFMQPEKTTLLNTMEEEEEEEEDHCERTGRGAGSVVTTTLTPKIDFFYADVGWIHQNISYSRGGGGAGGGGTSAFTVWPAGGFGSSTLAGKLSARKVNHFANHSELTRKDLLAKNLQRASRRAKKNGDSREAEAFERVSPKTYALPGDLALFTREFDGAATAAAAAMGSARRTTSGAAKEKNGGDDNDENGDKSNNVWIMKPIGQSQGRGIFFVWKRAQIRRWQNRRKKLDEELNANNNASGVGFSTATGSCSQHQHVLSSSLSSQYQQQSEHCSPSHQSQHVFQQLQQPQNNNATINICKENYVAQKYIHNPLLIGGRKFDMRLYVLVLSFSPLVAYVYREGFARFSSKRYESKIKSNSTENYFVHLTNHSVQKKGDNYNASVCDLKWPLHKLRRHIRATFDARAEEMCFKEIERMIKLSCDAVKSSMIRDERCFELYGYDVMLDEHLKPWLIEVNASPSMTADSVSDKELKTRVFEDVLNCVDFENKFTSGTTKEREGTNCSGRSSNNNSDRSTFSRKPTKPSSYTSRLARLPSRVGGFDAIVNESKEKEKTSEEKKTPTIGTVNTDREDNLKEIGVLSSLDDEDEDEDKESAQ